MSLTSSNISRNLLFNIVPKITAGRPVAKTTRPYHAGISSIPSHPLTCKSANLLSENPSCLTGLLVKPGFLEQRRYKRRQPIVYTKPLSFDYSGDLEKVPQLDPSSYVYKFQGLKELENAPETVKKLASLEFANRHVRKEHREHEVLLNIRQHLDGETGKEEKIARMTIELRNQINHCLVYRGDKRGKSLLIEKIAKRKKELKYLRKLDFERFYWLLHQLRIRYTSFPRYHNKPTKRYLRKQEVRKQARALWVEKMEAFRKSVEKEREQFYVKKADIMKEITEDLRALNVDEKKIFDEFLQSLEAPKFKPRNRQYERVLRKYQEALDAGIVVPKPQMSPIR